MRTSLTDHTTSRWPDRLAWLLLLLLAVGALLTVRDYGLGLGDYTPAQDRGLPLKLFTSGVRGTRALTVGQLHLSARARPAARRTSQAIDRDAGHSRHRLRPVDRLAHHGGLWRDRGGAGAGAAVRSGGAKRRLRRGARPLREAWAAADPDRNPGL